jgi:hypothetical protein
MSDGALRGMSEGPAAAFSKQAETSAGVPGISPRELQCYDHQTIASVSLRKVFYGPDRHL